MLLRFVKEFWVFGIIQIKNCFFPALLFIMLAVSHLIPASIIPRYDFMLIVCIAIQAIMYFTGMETKDEIWVICLFHLMGLGMEIFKVNIGSWSYPEVAYTKVLNVPLYSGFMYASVASYMCQAWRRFNLYMHHWPHNNTALVLALLMYLNFFSNHYIVDIRYYLGVLMVILFFKSKVEFTPIATRRYMPVIVSFLLIAFFLWVAENMATLLGAWKYSYQHSGWQMVKWQKFSSWFFMVIVSYIIVAELKQFKARWKRQSFNVS